MASVLPRKNKDGTITWRVQARDSQRRMRQESFVAQKGADQFGKLVDAVGWEAALAVRDARQGRDIEIPTLREFTARYLDPGSGLLSGVTAGTRDGYEAIAERSFLQVLGELPVSALTKMDVARWATWQEQQPSTRHQGQLVAAKTVKNYHGLLSSILAAANELHLIDVNPARGTKLTKGTRAEMVCLTPDEFATLLAFVAPYYQPLVLTFAGTGMRWGEATAITWADVDQSGRVPVMRVNKAWKKGPSNRAVLGPPKTPKSNRAISVFPSLIDALGARGPGDQLVFRGIQSGGRIWSYRFHASVWAPAVAAANDAGRCAELGLVPIGKRPRVHDLRHTHASWLIASGAPLAFIQGRLGHENISTTVDTYGHLMPDAHLQMADMTEQMMSNVLSPLPVLRLVPGSS